MSELENPGIQPSRGLCPHALEENFCSFFLPGKVPSGVIVLIIGPMLLAILWCRALVVVMHGLNEHR